MMPDLTVEEIVEQESERNKSRRRTKDYENERPHYRVNKSARVSRKQFKLGETGKDRLGSYVIKLCNGEDCGYLFKSRGKGNHTCSTCLNLRENKHYGKAAEHASISEGDVMGLTKDIFQDNDYF